MNQNLANHEDIISEMKTKRSIPRHNRWKLICLILIFFCFFFIHLFIDDAYLQANLLQKNASPSLDHLFGTDWLGRDMFLRTLKGLGISLKVGLYSSLLSTLIALFLSFLAVTHKIGDYIVTYLIDLCLSVPHLVTLILIVFVFGGGIKGVIFGIALTHWPRLTRLLRAEIFQIKTAPYVLISEKIGKSPLWLLKNHYLPQLFPQLIVGFTLLFPHAILHESAITFLGFGLSPEQPAIGIILSESMKYLVTGMWWLAFFPGLLLVLIVIIINMLGNTIQLALYPSESSS